MDGTHDKEGTQQNEPTADEAALLQTRHGVLKRVSSDTAANNLTTGGSPQLLLNQQSNNMPRQKVSSQTICESEGSCHSVCECEANGDVHVHRTFNTTHKFDFQSHFGTHLLARSPEHDFELQGFFYMCKIKNGNFNSCLSGVAMKYKTQKVTVVEFNELSTQESGDFTVSGTPDEHSDGLTIESKKAGVFTLWIKQFNHQSMEFDLDLQDPSKEDGLCAQDKDGWEGYPITGNDVIFSQSELTKMCETADMSNCDSDPTFTLLQSNRSSSSKGAGDGGVAVQCQISFIDIGQAESACAELQGSEFFDDCVYDYCALGGDDSAVESAKAAKQEMDEHDAA
jgi:hypothetical protein